jgi:copper homeostasis protein (lipoprotein)
MKNITLLISIAFILPGCHKNKEVKDPKPAPTEIIGDVPIPATQSTAENSLDYLGLYKGKLPCTNCKGIETSLELSEDFSYILTRRDLGKSDKAIEIKGTYSWNKSGNSILLDNIKNEPNQYFVGENSLTQLDMEGNKIIGRDADKYVLRKMTESQAAISDAPPEQTAVFDITTNHWKLAEVGGKKVASKDPQKDFYIEFKANNNFSAFAGCNHMAGHYEISKEQIKFLRVMATMMACQEMKPEEQLKAALETADNFVANEKVLQLRKGGTLLAKFEGTPFTASQELKKK